MHPIVVLSLLRRSDGLSAWVSDAAGDGSEPVLRRIALNELPAGLYPLRDALLADWHSLAAARELAPVWPAFWRIFWRTLTDARDQAPLAMPQRVAPAPPPTASAAHPRAFRGTKFQPPKSVAPLLNLCAWLADDRLLDGFFARHDFTRLPALAADGQPLSALPKPDQPVTVAALLAHGSGVGPGQSPALPQAFRHAFLWHLQARPQSELLAWLRIWRGFGSPERGRDLALLARFCALAPAGHDWAGLALNLSPPRQSLFVTTLLTQRAHLLPYGVLSLSQLTELEGLNADDQRFACYLTAVLSNLHRKVSAAYSLCGCALANRLTSQYRIENLGFRLMATKDCARVPMADIDRMSAALGADGEHWEMTVWENCGRLPGFDTVLRDTCWEKLGSDAADQWLATFTQMVWDDEPEEKIQRNWRAHLACFREWHRGLLTLSSARQAKYVQMLRNHAYDWADYERLSTSVPYLLPLQLRLCSPPFSEKIEGQSAITSMAKHLSMEGWRQLAATDDRTWLAVERACRRDNDATLISRGLYSLTLCWPDFTLRSFSAAAKRLMRTAQLLGCLSYERRRQFLAETSHAVWFATNWTALEPDEACRRLYQLCRESGLNSPVPRRLREHFEGLVTLTQGQIKRHCRVSLARLPIVLLAALEAAIWRSIDAPFNLRGQSVAASHAVRLLAGQMRHDNRKALRRFLLDYGQERAHAYLDHPLNRAWLARHPRIDPQLWCRNPPGQGASGTAEFHLALETDPLEILMLGTYVGSCLGLGGLCDYSPVACLLDANKQVVYARDASGRVLARQLLAIDEDDRLICYAVYPVTANEALLRAFLAFDKALAEALGVDIYRHQDNDNGYYVSEILARSWWDDDVWQDTEQLNPA